MAEQKACKQCQKQFVVEDDDLEFYKKISPTFAEKTFEIPAPTLCPDCRMRRRLSWRNERSLYKRNCDLCNREMVTYTAKTLPLKSIARNAFGQTNGIREIMGKILIPINHFSNSSASFKPKRQELLF